MAVGAPGRGRRGPTRPWSASAAPVGENDLQTERKDVLSMSRILPRSTPAAEGVDPAALRRLVDGLDGLEDVHSVMVVRHGRVITEGWWHPHTPDRPHVMFSVSKSFTSTAVGLAVHEGLLTLDDKVVDLLSDAVPDAPGEHLRAMRVRDLLTMTSGHGASTMEGIDRTISLPGAGWARSILAQPVEHEPGTHFVYNTGATYLLSAILHRLTGQRLLDYLTPRLFAPLGITHATWEQDPEGIDAGGFGLSVTTEEMAAFGQLYLQEGVWAGEQLVPAEWVAAATSRQVDSGPHDWPEWQQGYGFQFWRSRYGAYRADGAFGQYIVVWPEKDLVVAITSGLANLQSVHDVLWSALLPDDVWDTPAAQETARPFELALATPSGKATSPSAPGGVVLDLAANDLGVRSLTLTQPDDGGTELVLTGTDAEHRVRFGHGEWVQGVLPEGDVAAAAAWTDESTWRGRVLFLGTPFEWRVVLRFAGDAVRVAVDRNVAFGERRLLRTTGTVRPA